HFWFSSLAGADLRDATVECLCDGIFDDLGSAKLDGVTTRLGDYTGMPSFDLTKVAASIGGTGLLTFISPHGSSSHTATEFNGLELQQLRTLFVQMHGDSSDPSVDCAQAHAQVETILPPKVETILCGDPGLSALDSALNWLWQSVEHSPPEIAAQ